MKKKVCIRYMLVNKLINSCKIQFLKQNVMIFAPHILKELSVNCFRQLNCNYKLVAYKSLQKLFCIHSQVKKKEENGHAGGKCVLIFYCCRRYAVRVA